MRRAIAPFLSVFLTLFLSISLPAYSQTYYVGSVSGNDNNLIATLADHVRKALMGHGRHIAKVYSGDFLSP